MRNNRKGFTIVELVIVIAVIGILAAVLIPTFSNVTENARASARLQETRNVMVSYLGSSSDASLEAGTQFFYLDGELPTDADKTVKAYLFTYQGGELLVTKEPVVISGTATEGEYTYNGYTYTFIDNLSPNVVITKTMKLTPVTPDEGGGT